MSLGLNARYIASTDLTHYGENYQFSPAGSGVSAMQWAKENDQSLIDLMLGFQVDQIVPEAQKKQSACGPGAVAALLAACRENGAQTCCLLEQRHKLMRPCRPSRRNLLSIQWVTHR